ncbi:hypothetical protein Bca4012_022636 [Brassica carinata]
MYRNHQRIHQLEKGVSVRPITGRLLEGRLINNNQPPKPIFLIEGDEYEFSVFSVLPNFRERKLTQLPYYIQIDHATTITNVTDIGPIFPKMQLLSSNYKCLLRSATTLAIYQNKPAIEFGTLQCKMDRKFKVVIVTSIIPRLFKGN